MALAAGVAAVVAVTQLREIDAREPQPAGLIPMERYIGFGVEAWKRERLDLRAIDRIAVRAGKPGTNDHAFAEPGWLKSAVFGKSFRLTRQVDPLGDPRYTLAVRR